MSRSSTPPDDTAAMLNGRGSRRAFLRNTGVTAIVGRVLVAGKGAADQAGRHVPL